MGEKKTKKEEMKYVFIVQDTSICSLNNAYATKDRKKSTRTKEWLWNLKVQLRRERDQIEDIKNRFDRKKHFLTAEYIWFIPHLDFYTLKKEVSLRNGDCSNFAKIPDDMVFNEVLGIDDGAICKETVVKLPWIGIKNHIKITVQIVELKYLEQKCNIELPDFLKT